MPGPYKKQTDVIPEAEKMKQKHLDYLNSRFLTKLENVIGANISRPGDQVPVSGGVPRLFILDEKDPTNPKTLEAEKVEVGSMLFWELMQKGKMFAVPAGEKEPIQLQVTVPDAGAPSLSVSEPLSAQPDKLASRNFVYERKAPKPKELPRQAPQPGLFARFAHMLNKNWYKREHEAYQNSLRERERVAEENRRAQEAFRQEEARAKEETNAACLAVSKGAEQAFGALRTKEILAAELEQQKNRQAQLAAEEKQASLNEAAETAKENAEKREDRINNMVHIYGPKPTVLPKLENKHVYNAKDLTILKPIELPKDLRIGKKQVDDRLFAELALFAQLNKETARNLLENKRPGLRKEILDEGLTEKEADDMLIQKAGGMIVADFVSDSIRPDLRQHFQDRTQPGRERAQKALEEYGKGNKEPLAEIIAQAAEYTANGAVDEDSASRSTLTIAKLSGEVLDLLEEDPELWEAAERKGLTDHKFETCRGMDAIRELEDKSLLAEEKMRKAVAEHRELSGQEKKECLKDMFKYRTAKAMLSEQADAQNSKNVLTAKKRLDDRLKATELAKSSKKPLPEGMKPIDDSLLADLNSFHYRPKLMRTPAIMRTLAENWEEAREAVRNGEQPEPDELDKIAEMTVQGLKLDEKDTKTLADTLGGGKGPTGKILLGEQGKLLAAREREKQQDEQLERELNDAVLYDEPQL